MIQKIILTGIASIGAGILYRIGGSDEGNTKIRDLGIPFLFCVLLWTLGGLTTFWAKISLIPSFLLLFASLTTYFKKKGTDAEWWNWALVGIATAFSAIFYAWATGHWIGFWLRCIVNTVLITLCSEFIGKDWLEEGLRGFWIMVTVPLLLL